jgi:catechol 2,3-dioxygenase-like lactoylglutathione lyase family enzyme
MHPMQVHIARHTDRLEEVVHFYRDQLGLPERGRFEAHAGYDGVFIDLPGTHAHLEFTTGGAHGAPPPHPESLLVLYLGSWDVVRAAADRVTDAPVAPANPYWAECGVTLADPTASGSCSLQASGAGADVRLVGAPRGVARPPIGAPGFEPGNLTDPNHETPRRRNVALRPLAERHRYESKECADSHASRAKSGDLGTAPTSAQMQQRSDGSRRAENAALRK